MYSIESNALTIAEQVLLAIEWGSVKVLRSPIPSFSLLSFKTGAFEIELEVLFLHFAGSEDLTSLKL